MKQTTIFLKMFPDRG